MKQQQSLLLSLFLLSQLILSSSAQSCTKATFSNKLRYASCNSLPKLGASLHWTYHATNGTADIAYRAPQPSNGWVAWGINPTSTGMLGSQALIAFPGSDGAMNVYTTNLSSYTPTIKNESLSFPVFNRSTELDKGIITIFATIKLPENSTKVNQVWQAGTAFSRGIPSAHPTTGDNIQSTGNLNFLSGEAVPAGGSSSQHMKKKEKQNASAQSCTSNNLLYASCNSLPKLGASLHWTYHPTNGTVDIAYRAPQSANGWVAWAINPTSTGMPGSQALIAFRGSDGAMTVYTTSLSGYTPTIKNESLSFPVFSRSAEFSNGFMTIFATVKLPKNSTTVNQVWQAGTAFSQGIPSGHLTSGDNVQSMGSLDFLSGVAAAAGDSSRLHRKNIHGILNAVSWGILLPTGAIIARYLKVFKSADPAWFYLHVACQSSAYIIGVAGWGTGLKLGSESAGITYHPHRNIGIALFCLGTLQVFALLLRPKKEHKFRLYWNIYHYAVGYTVIILSVINIFKGFDILKPDSGWKTAYIVIIATLGGIALFLEAVTWTIVLKRRSRSNVKPHHVANGTNGYGV